MEMICINCPLGCHLKIDENMNVTGNNCPRGKQYAIDEMTHPLITLTTTVAIESVTHERLSIITDKPVPKNMMMDIVRSIKDLKVKPPVKMGDVIVENVLNTGSNLIASRSIER